MKRDELKKLIKEQISLIGYVDMQPVGGLFEDVEEVNEEFTPETLNGTYVIFWETEDEAILKSKNSPGLLGLLSNIIFQSSNKKKIGDWYLSNHIADGFIQFTKDKNKLL